MCSNMTNDSFEIGNKDEKTSRQYNIGLLAIGLLPLIALNTQSWYGNKDVFNMFATILISTLILLTLGIVLVLINKTEKENKP